MIKQFFATRLIIYNYINCFFVYLEIDFVQRSYLLAIKIKPVVFWKKQIDRNDQALNNEQ